MTLCYLQHTEDVHQSPEPMLHGIVLELARAPTLQQLAGSGCDNVLGFAAARYLNSLQVSRQRPTCISSASCTIFCTLAAPQAHPIQPLGW